MGGLSKSVYNSIKFETVHGWNLPPVLKIVTHTMQLFLVWSNNFDQTMCSYWSYMLLRQPPVLMRPWLEQIKSKYHDCTVSNFANNCSSTRPPSHQVVQVLLPAVSGVVLAQGSHQDHADQAHQEDDHHEGVEDWKPVDLKERQCWQWRVRQNWKLLQDFAESLQHATT